MSGYQLEATDGSGRHTVPAGETVIGRGPFLGIADKRVSRSHAVLEVVDDKLRIKGMHVNPCFYQVRGKSTFVPLEINEWCWLHSGDCISLLPDKYSFRVIAKDPSEEATLRNSQGVEEESESNDNSTCSPITSSPGHVPSSLSAASNTRTDGKLHNHVACAADGESSQPARRKRVLPNWMLQGDLPVQALPSHVITAGKKKRTMTQRTQKTSSSKSKEEYVPEKKQPEVSFPTTSSSLPRAATPVNLQKSLVVDNEEDYKKEEHCDYTPKLSTPPPSNSCSPGSPSTSNNKSSVAKADNSDNISLSPTSTQNSQQAPKKRVPCIYGEQCYRKNPTHFQEFSHPGDSDYHDVENGSQDDNDDRPECPYGTDCYRKNPQHKLEYKHTRPPGRKLRKRNPKKAKRSLLDGDSDDDGESNDYDLEDSFIDDDEDEDFDITDEDSDWMPDSGDKDSEDVKELLTEAKKFMRRKR
ncbi:aprataxin and PNK-like factor isoform X1 [Bufo bufo]|uniref:aprataxin and PNK-like factor isoform X1 n=1 Tax=Bufo bufo TaxID=8384 RepID=UPI001ABDAB3D|nr:aprataxin and PNK-like factor isoform X1 [Bufo bufo]